MKMPAIKAMRFARRILFDIFVNRPDTYIRPFAESLPGMVSKTQHETQSIMRQMKYKGTYSNKVVHTMQFPKDWVTK